MIKICMSRFDFSFMAYADPRLLFVILIICGAVASPHAEGSPVGPASASAPATPVTIQVPFDFSQGVVILKVDLGGNRPARLALDTGNTPTIIDTEAAHQLGLPLLEADKVTAGSGAKAVIYYRVAPAEFRLGPATLMGKQIVVTSISKDLQKDGVTCDGLVGYAAFRNRVVQIDYPSRELRLLDPSDVKTVTTAAPGFVISWKKYWSGSPKLVTVDDVQLESHRLSAQVDLFYKYSAILFVTKLPWLKMQPIPGLASVHYEEADVPPIRLPDALKLGDCRLDAGTPMYAAGANAHIPETDLTVVLGTGFFSNKILTLDFPSSRLIVERHPRSVLN